MLQNTFKVCGEKCKTEFADFESLKSRIVWKRMEILAEEIV